MVKFPEPLEGTVFYEDEFAYACLAFHPIAPGHTIVAWKKDVEDLNDLQPEEYSRFANVIYRVRQALLAHYDAPKVYVAYLDEFMHVHAHLVPRTKDEKKGFGLLNRPHGELAGTDFVQDVEALKSLMS